MYKYMSIYYDAPHSLLTYMPENTVVFIDEMSRVKEMAESLHKEEAQWLTALVEQGEIVQPAIERIKNSKIKELVVTVEEKLVDEYISLTRITEINMQEKIIKVEAGNVLEQLAPITKEDFSSWKLYTHKKHQLLKEELAKELGFYDTVQKEGWGGIRAKDAGNMVKRAIEIAEGQLASQQQQKK